MSSPTAEHVSTACLVCDATLRPHPALPGLLLCPACAFVTADVQLSDEQLRDLYGADYFHGEEYADYVAEGDELRVNFRRRLDTLLALQPEQERHRLYEVGAAYGFFLDEARKAYDDVAGIDITEDGPRYAREVLGLDVASGDYLATELEEQVDALCLWDTIEHLGKPRQFLEKAARDVRPGGLVTVTTGDLGSRNARFRGKRWRMIHPPTHLHYFSRATLTQLLDRCGFDVVHVSTAGNVRSVRGILYGVLVLRSGKQGLYDRLSRLPGLDRSVSLDLRDIMYVVARRRAA
jgi:SAM-dependent methyltransferase